MKNNDVIPLPEVLSTHADEARHFSEQAEECNTELAKLYVDGERRDSNAIAAVHQTLRTSLKLAEVHSLMAIADEMRRLREELTA